MPKVTRMRTATLPFHTDSVSSPVAAASALACGVAAPVMLPAFNFLQANYPPLLLNIQ